jgi:hypothetical protein
VGRSSCVVLQMGTRVDGPGLSRLARLAPRRGRAPTNPAPHVQPTWAARGQCRVASRDAEGTSKPYSRTHRTSSRLSLDLGAATVRFEPLVKVGLGEAESRALLRDHTGPHRRIARPGGKVARERRARRTSTLPFGGSHDPAPEVARAPGQAINGVARPGDDGVCPPRYTRCRPPTPRSAPAHAREIHLFFLCARRAGTVAD